MFQTEPILFLQSLASDWLTGLMVIVTAMGYAPFYIAGLSLVTFGISLRKGFLLTQMVLWVSVFTDLMKNGFALPRPVDVDSNVQHLGKGYPNEAPFTGKGAAGFFELMDAEAIRVYRAQPEWSYGFPSGHVSSTVAFWGGLSLLFRSRAIWAVTGVMVILMPLSRMYLGRHFLADVLGGLALGGVAVAIAHRLRSVARVGLAARLPRIALAGFLLLGPLVLLGLHSWVEVERTGQLFGMNVAFLLVGLGGFPDDGGSLPRRAGRVILGAVLYLAVGSLIGAAVDGAGLDDDAPAVAFLSAAAATFVMFWGTVRIGLWTGLYKKGEGIY